MSENPAPDNLDWSANQVKAHLLALLNAMENRVNDRFAAQEKAFHAAISSASMARDAQTLEFRAQFAAMEKAVSAALASSDKAVLKAEVASEKRFDSVNEFRGALADAQSALMPRAEATVLFSAMNEKIAALAEHDSETTGKSKGLSAGGTVFLGIIGAILTLVTLFNLIVNFAK